jgi:hypothetical protein
MELYLAVKSNIFYISCIEDPYSTKQSLFSILVLSIDFWTFSITNVAFDSGSGLYCQVRHTLLSPVLKLHTPDLL